MAKGGDFLDLLGAKYRLILCDLWGVVHDGYSLLPGAAERLREWRREGRLVVLITNAPRGVEAVEEHLAQVGLPRDCWDAIVSGGEAGIAAINALGVEVGFLGTLTDREVLEGKGVRIRDDESFDELACTGLDEGRPAVADYRPDLERWAARGVHMHCLNPDRVVIHGGSAQLCAGALADAYEKIGGRVSWYGKPFPAIYRHALALAGNPPRDTVLAIGDGLHTDVLGAARMGFDAVFVTGGIHRGEPFPDSFARDHGLGEWAPVAVVDSLGVGASAC
jgi:HAD superfamily hydrolase (TIGR01459 family)